MGDLDLVRPLGLAGVRCVAVCRPGDPVRFSRFTVRTLDRDDPALLERLLALAGEEPVAPALFYESDGALRFVSEHRKRLAGAYRFIVPPPEMVEDLLDKGRFHRLAMGIGLQVPRTREIQAGSDDRAEELELGFPLIVKPLGRDDRWFRAVGWSKVKRVDDRRAWVELRQRLAHEGIDAIAQELIPGGEDRIESYHAYLDSSGRLVGDFLGRKIRTLPREFGVSTALVTTAEESVRHAGRDALQRIGYRGVAKLDFKRAPDGGLHLLEVNPRLSLWAHLGAVAGVNLPALVYRDLTGCPVDGEGTARPGVRWCELRGDAAAVREAGESILRWVPWALRCEAKSETFLDDPMPLLRGKLWPRLTGERSLR